MSENKNTDTATEQETDQTVIPNAILLDKTVIKVFDILRYYSEQTQKINEHMTAEMKCQNPDIEKLQELLDKITNLEKEVSRLIPDTEFKILAKLIITHINYIENLTPYIEKELSQLQKQRPETVELTLQEVIDCIDIIEATDNQKKEEIFAKAKEYPGRNIKTALKYLEDVIILIQKAKEKYKTNNNKISVGAKKPDSILFPLDKVTQDIFDFVAVKSCRRTINVEKSDSNDKLDTVITLDFSKLEESGNLTFKKLTPFEKRVYVACGALQEVGNEYISATQIYKQMGGKGRPATYQIKKIIEACEGMSCTKIKIDNKEESEKYNYPRFREDLIYLFPAESVKNVEINGKTVDYCLHFLKDELPLFTFAKQRKQITAYTLEQWTLPFSMTDDNLALDDYFRSRIARMNRDNNKKKSYNGKMLYTAIYKACVIDTPKKRSRATTKFRKLLDHYQKTGIIKGYQEQQDDIIIIL